MKQFNFLTAKPVIYVCNVKDDEINNIDSNKYFRDVLKAWPTHSRVFKMSW